MMIAAGPVVLVDPTTHVTSGTLAAVVDALVELELLRKLVPNKGRQAQILPGGRVRWKGGCPTSTPKATRLRTIFDPTDDAAIILKAIEQGKRVSIAIYLVAKGSSRKVQYDGPPHQTLADGTYVIVGLLADTDTVGLGQVLSETRRKGVLYKYRSVDKYRKPFGGPGHV